MTTGKKPLLLFTRSFPYGRGEAFIEKEIPYLCKEFREVYILPLIKQQADMRDLPLNVKVINILDNEKLSSVKAFLWGWPLFFKIFGTEVLCRNIPTDYKRYLKSLLLNAFARALVLNKFFASLPSSVVCYSYWMNDWVTILGICRRKGLKAPVISRAHGFDLFEDRNKYGFIPFRKFQLETIDKVFVVSTKGAQYLRSVYPKFQKKIDTMYLGVEDEGVNPFNNTNDFVVVSCSNIIPLKRIHLIVKILSNVSFPVKWYHFGEGELREQIEAKAKTLPKHVSVNFMGSLPNREVLKFYKQNPVNLFVNVSESEGLPVSMMEAISFGIPLLATDVGGVAEIVTDQTGILIPVKFDIEKVAHILGEFRSNALNSIEGRRQVRNFWKKKFWAGENYTKFYRFIQHAF